MFLNSIEKRGIESTIGDASAYGRWLLEQYGTTSSGVQVTEQTALTLVYAYSAIKVLSETLAHVPLNLMKENPKGPKKAFLHPLYDVMAFQPTSKQTSYNFRNVLEGHRNGWGNAYSEILFEGGRAVGLKMMYPDRTTPRELLIDKSIVYEINDVGPTRILPAANVLHIPGLGYNGIAGYSPVQMAKETLGLGMAIHEFGSKFFAGGATPKGIIETESAPNTLLKFIEEYRRRYGSLSNSHETHILPKGMSYKPLTINPDDAQTLETLKYNRTEIAGLYRVPLSFIMDYEFNTFTNAAEQDIHFLKHTMVPIFTNWEQELNRKLLTAKERRLGYYFKFDVFWLLRGDTKTRYAAYHQALQDTWLTRNEVRRLEDFEERDDMSEVLVPTNMVPADQLGNNEPVVGNEAPVAEALAQRMASNERKSLENAGEDISKIAKFYKKYPEFIKRHLYPLATMLEHRLNVDVDTFITQFTDTYIERQLEQMKDSVSEVNVTEGSILNTLYEVIQWEKK